MARSCTPSNIHRPGAARGPRGIRRRSGAGAHFGQRAHALLQLPRRRRLQSPRAGLPGGQAQGARAAPRAASHADSHAACAVQQCSASALAQGRADAPQRPQLRGPRPWPGARHIAPEGTRIARACVRAERARAAEARGWLRAGAARAAGVPPGEREPGVGRGADVPHCPLPALHPRLARAADVRVARARPRPRPSPSPPPCPCTLLRLVLPAPLYVVGSLQTLHTLLPVMPRLCLGGLESKVSFASALAARGCCCSSASASGTCGPPARHRVPCQPW
jgi:hypothetical protein